MSYAVKLLGTKYTCELQFDKNQWYLRIMLGKSIEEGVILRDLSLRGLREGLTKLLEKVDFDINQIQQKLIIDDLSKQAHHLFYGESEIEEDQQPQHPVKNVIPHSDITENQKIVREFKEMAEEYENPTEPQVEMSEKEPTLDEENVDEMVIYLYESNLKMKEMLGRLQKRISKLEQLSLKLIQITERLIGE